MAEIILNRQRLVDLAKSLGVRKDWHEPDEQGVSAEVSGTQLDNAGFWGSEARRQARDGELPATALELSVKIKQYGTTVAEVNLATLLAWATGYQDG